MNQLLIFVCPTTRGTVHFDASRGVVCRIVIYLSPYPARPVRRLLFYRALISARRLFRRSAAFHVRTFNCLRLPTSYVEVRNYPCAASQRLRRPTSVLYCSRVPNQSWCVNARSFPLYGHVIRRPRQEELRTDPSHPFHRHVFLYLSDSRPNGRFLQAPGPKLYRLVTRRAGVNRRVLAIDEVFQSWCPVPTCQ